MSINIQLDKEDTTYTHTHTHTGGSDGKEFASNAEDPNLIPGLGRSLVEGNRNPLQYSCLESSMDRGAWQAIVHEVTKSWTQLSNFHIHTYILVVYFIHNSLYLLILYPYTSPPPP